MVPLVAKSTIVLPLGRRCASPRTSSGIVMLPFEGSTPRYDQTWVAVSAVRSSFTSIAYDPPPSPAAAAAHPVGLPAGLVLSLLKRTKSSSPRMWKPCSPPLQTTSPPLNELCTPPPVLRTQTVAPPRVILVRQ